MFFLIFSLAFAKTGPKLEILDKPGDILEDRIVELNDDSFEHDTQAASGATTGDWFVYFYSDSIEDGRFARNWNELGKKVEANGEFNVNIAKVDCDNNGRLVKRFGVKDFPTLLYFRSGIYYIVSPKLSFDRLFGIVSEKKYTEFPHYKVPDVPGILDSEFFKMLFSLPLAVHCIWVTVVGVVGYYLFPKKQKFN